MRTYISTYVHTDIHTYLHSQHKTTRLTCLAHGLLQMCVFLIPETTGNLVQAHRISTGLHQLCVFLCFLCFWEVGSLGRRCIARAPHSASALPPKREAHNDGFLSASYSSKVGCPPSRDSRTMGQTWLDRARASVRSLAGGLNTEDREKGCWIIQVAQALLRTSPPLFSEHLRPGGEGWLMSCIHLRQRLSMTCRDGNCRSMPILVGPTLLPVFQPATQWSAWPLPMEFSSESRDLKPPQTNSETRASW